MRTQISPKPGMKLFYVVLAGFLMVYPQNAVAAVDPVPIPELALWETHMTDFGKQHCAVMNAGTGTSTERLANTDYDAERVYYQMAMYTSDPSWKFCANLAETTYRDGFVLPKNGNVPGDRLHSMGLKMDYSQTTDESSKTAVGLLSQNSIYARGNFSDVLTQSYRVSLEVAYALMTLIDAEDLGEPKKPKYDTYVTQALGHIDQWYTQRLWETPGQYPHQPFMVGLTLQALIQAHAHQSDPRIPPKIKLALDGLWDTAWRSNEQAFYLNNENASDRGDPSHNLLIAPAYAWYYLETGDTLYRDRGDQIFAGGVKDASLTEARQFNENYMGSFDYVIWRQAANAKYGPPPPPPTEPSNISPKLKRIANKLLHVAERLTVKSERLSERADNLADKKPRKAERLENRAERLMEVAEHLAGWANAILEGTWTKVKECFK